MLALRSRWGAVGYAYYMMILETMREQSNFMLEHCPSITEALAYEFRITSDEVDKFINDCAEFGLFVISDDFIWSESFIERMEKMTEKATNRSNKAKKAANARWKGKSDANPMHKHSTSNADAMPTQCGLMPIKLNQIKLNNIDDDAPDFNIYSYLEKSFGRTISRAESERFMPFTEEFNSRMLCEAIDRTEIARATSINYTIRILENWKKDNISTIKQVKEADGKRSSKKKTNQPKKKIQGGSKPDQHGERFPNPYDLYAKMEAEEKEAR